MRLSELMGKRIINIYDGDILGTVGDSDLVIDTKTGDITSLILPHYNEGFLGKNDKGVLNIPWSSICKIGSEVIVVDIEKY